MAFRAPLLGYNTNVRHKGKLYHIQTEDSGIDHPHVITHLFADGGRIVATRKTSYAERVGSEGLAETVKKLMQAQHKAMFIALRDGNYDEDDIAEEMQEALHEEPELTPPPGPMPPPPVPLPAPSPVSVERATGLHRTVQLPATRVERAEPAVAAQPRQPPRSLFGGELPGDKSLDEVILTYLAANDGE